MGLGSRRASRHDTEAVRKLAGVRSEDYWDHSPGDHVMTCDGFPGVVTAVLDGFAPGNESYEVKLDGGTGGGLYSSGQLRQRASTEASTAHTAESDYPELGSILRDRPDPALDQVMARRQAAEYSPETEEAELVNPGISASDPELDPDAVEEDFDHQASLGTSTAYAILAEAMAQGATDAEVDSLMAAAGLRRSATSANPWGEPEPRRVDYQPGPTSPPNPGQNPASAGPLSAMDPDGWNRGELPTRVTPIDAYAALHDEPEPALPFTDGADEADSDLPRQARFHFANPALLAALPELMGASEAGAGGELAGSLPGMMGGGESHGGGADEDAGSHPTPDPTQTGEQAIRDPAVTSRAGLNIEPDPEMDDAAMSDLAPRAAMADDVDDVVRQFQATAAGRDFSSGVSKTALKDFTADERKSLIDEGRGTRAGNLDKLDVAGTHYAAQLDDEDVTWLG
jgi:hypothetical protein